MTSILTRPLGASVAAALAAVLIIATPASATPGTTTVGDYMYSYDDADVAAGATITDYVGTDTVLTIPGTVTIGLNTYDVTTIGEGAFAVNALTSVTIPGSVTTISIEAFAFNYLTSVTIPGSVTTIGVQAFYFNALTSVTIPGSVTTIGNAAFYHNALTSVTIPGSVTTIDDYAFRENALTSVTIGGSVTTIGDYAFRDNALTSVTIPDSVTTIGESAFNENPLGSVLMQGPVPSSIGDAPFGTAGASTPLVSFYSAYASSGYTTPTWTAGGQAYRSEALGAVEAYITQVYQDLFDRTPDAGGLATWTGLLMAGTPYGEVANGITYSDEYRSRLIQASYQQYLGRAAEPAGLASWLGGMRGGMHIEQMQAGFISSPEFYARYGSTDRGWITGLYQTVLARDPGSSEVDYWQGRIGAGYSRYQVALGFLYSTEHLTNVVDGYYVDLLGRHIDPSGKATWVGQIQVGHRDEEIIASIVSSAEYRAKV